jgi:hypothetical protein
VKVTGALRSGAGLALVFICSNSSLVACAVSTSPDSAWELSVGGQVGVPRGYVQVRENHVPGTRLQLHRDLGIDTSESLVVGAAYRLTPLDALRLTFDTVFLYGGSRLPTDVDFNGTTLRGGTNIDTRPEFFRLTALYERRLFGLGAGGYLAGDVGLTFVFLTFQLHGTVSSRTKSADMGEDFVTQELPVPLLGFRIDRPLVERLSLVGSLTGGYLPRVDSLRHEGGDVKLSQTHADALAGLRYRLTPAFDVEAGYRFTYFVQREVSREDGNSISLWDNGVSALLTYRF